MATAATIGFGSKTGARKTDRPGEERRPWLPAGA
jgi:hypothetical protein